ncbi:unnamed protein product [Adineta steineri]|uniref:Peptide hydrolase n=1 Tax=Adineta steineri TaxID=433720 RepID=A0A814T2Z5_9BILA|nr:unnamed protein product [Adineta steineri]CAF3807071.1 unnamed protein product [Adineta steineri]
MLGVICVFVVVTCALAAATLATLIKRFDSIKDSGSEQTTVAPTHVSLTQSVRVEDAMAHLNEFQRIAHAESRTRAVNTPGFNRTLDYITNYLSANTNYNVTKSYFPIKNFELARNSILLSSISGTIIDHMYSNDLSKAEFYHVHYSTQTNFSSFVSLTAIPNLGCSDADWLAASSPPVGRVALVKRGDCTFGQKSSLAIKYNVTTILFYNDGTSSDRIAPIALSLGRYNTLPALSLSFTLGQLLVNMTSDPSINASIRIEIALKNEGTRPVGNICADTLTGDPTQTIVIGSHTDSVPDGPGINDNGSGSAANLVMAVALARLFQTPTYTEYKYRVRFCWWGAEELGLSGSTYHVTQARNSTTVGERITDYLVNFNYDMVGSSNYIFGIYDGKTAQNSTPSSAIPGSNKISALFRDWFIGQNLPWDFADFNGRSDYGPFLAAGIVAGGVTSGSNAIKTQEQRDRYDRMLGQGLGGIVGAMRDPCYHQACDTIQNINIFAYEKILKAAAYALEYLGRQNDLKTWLYPSTKIEETSH